MIASTTLTLLNNEWQCMLSIFYSVVYMCCVVVVYKLCTHYYYYYYYYVQLSVIVQVTCQVCTVFSHNRMVRMVFNTSRSRGACIILCVQQLVYIWFPQRMYSKHELESCMVFDNNDKKKQYNYYTCSFLRRKTCWD